jgi:two-component system sensor histidine kinase UhpB
MGLMNTEGILIEANQTALNFFRLTKEEVIGTNFVDSRWFSEATRQKAKIALAKAVQGETVNFELELVLLDGRVVVIDFSIRPIIDKNGKVILLIPEGKDITEKLKMEKEIELARLTKQKDILMAGIEGQEKQRKEIARELHDNINQVLATVKIYLQLAGENSDMRERLIKKSYENVSHAIEEVRKLSRTLAPPTLDDCTLIEALQQLVNDMVLSLLFDIHLNHREFDEKLIDNTQKMAVYRIAQEQFTNILKYARASKIELSIKTTSDDLLLCIADNGIGFSAQDKFRGTGLKNIMNRVEALNGIFNIETAPDKGCKLCIQLPLIKKPCI